MRIVVREVLSFVHDNGTSREITKVAQNWRDLRTKQKNSVNYKKLNDEKIQKDKR